MQLAEWLDDLCVRFIINLPVEELSSAARICFQIEEAQWFYEDFVRPLDPEFPSLNLRTFSAVMFQHCPLLKEYTAEDQERAFNAFLEYKTMVPVRGAIMLNDAMDEVVLVKGWKKGANWSFPRGKIDQNELDLTCAVREVYEETGYDLKEAGLVGSEEEMKSINLQIRGQDLMMYVFRGVPMHTKFLPRTRKEISKVQWHKLSELPTVKSKKQQQQGRGEDLAANANKFYMVAPFLGQLKKWIAYQKKHDKATRSNEAKTVGQPNTVETENLASDIEAVEEQGKLGKLEQDHLSRLLHTLRQSSQVSSELPEVSHLPQERPIPTEVPPAKSADLKAVLFGNAHQATEKPQTRFGQVITQPNQPRSPTRNHPHQVSDLPSPPGLSIQRQLQPYQPHARDHAPASRTTEHISTALPDPQLRPIPPPTQPAKLAPRPPIPEITASIEDKIFPPACGPDAHIPHSGSMSRGHRAFVAPPASTLPIPNLDPTKAALLNLFKSGAPSKAPEPRNTVPDASSTQGSKASPSAMTPTMFVPPQVSRRSSERALQEQRRPSAQQAKLLDLFRSGPTKNEQQSLEPPRPAVELSASPLGAHSRGNSNVAPLSQLARLPRKDATLGQVKIQKRPQNGHAPVSATVTGPLNIPQFDMIRSASQEKQDGGGSKQAVEASPVQVLSRSSSSHAHINSPSQNSAVHTRIQSHKQKSQPPFTNTPPKTRQPLTPDLKAKDAQAKPFQPQILRRPGASGSFKEPLPNQPLPSPQHKAAESRDATLPNEHKKSLLSLFTEPSPAPVISPPNGTPIDPASFSGIVSPIGKSGTPPHGRLGNLPSDVFEPASIASALNPPIESQTPAKQPRKFHAPDRMPPPLTRTKTSTMEVVDGGGPSRNGERHGSNASTITPANQQYLLGFLKGLK